MEMKTIQIGVELKERLDAKKIHNRESYNDVILKLINNKPEYDRESMMETLEILSDPETLRDIAKGLEDIKAGRVYTLEEVRKRNGL